MGTSPKKPTTHVRQLSGRIGPGHRHSKQKDPTAEDVVRAHYRFAKLAERRSLNARAAAVAAGLTRLCGAVRGAQLARRWQKRTGDRRYAMIASILEHSQVA